MLKSIVVTKDNLNICVNYYTELYGVISILTSNQESIKKAGIERANKKYRNEVLEYFKEYKDCCICKTFETLSQEYYFNYDAPVSLFLQLSNKSLNRKELCKYRREIPSTMFKSIIKEIKNFEVKSDFEKFYNNHLYLYKQEINNFINEIEKYNPISYLNHLLKMKNNKEYYINLMNGICNANYGTNTKNKMYANIRSYFKSKYQDMPDFSYEPIYYTTLILHEFAHSFINDIVGKRKKLVNEIDVNKYKSILEKTTYGDNLCVYIDETIIRAIECLYVEETFNNEYDNYVEEYYKDGFICIKEVIESIRKYKENINKYHDFEDYLENIIKLF